VTVPREHSNKTHLILRDPKPPTPEGHRCVVEHGDFAADEDNGMILQCVCGKRYRCRRGYLWADEFVWVRRIWPRPPKQDWP
jgi:hypothetical protein